MKNRLITSLLVLLLPVITVFAQVPPPPDQGEDALGPGAPDNPIDQYLLILLVVAVFMIGYFVLHQRRLISKTQAQ